MLLKDLASKKVVTPVAKREAIDYAREHHALSEPRACSLVWVSRRVIRYQPTKVDDAPLRARLREQAAARRRLGHRRIGYLLACADMTPNHKKLLQIYRDENLRIRYRGRRERALGTRSPMVLPDGPTSVGRWTSSLTR